MAICPAGDLHHLIIARKDHIQNRTTKIQENATNLEVLPVHLSLELETKYNSLSIFPGIYSSTLSSRKGAAGNLLSSTPSFPNGALLETYRK
jgi:hypothetical protein